VAAYQVQKGVECFAWIAVRSLEAISDELDQILVTKRVQRDRPRLVEQRPLAIGEQRIEHARLRAGEDVAGLVSVELNRRSIYDRMVKTAITSRYGAELNFDYRFAWLRDLSLTIRSLWIAACV
jgi:hypothetical protein